MPGRFYEFVQPPPLLSFLVRRRTCIILVSILLIVAFADPVPAGFAAGLLLVSLGVAIRFWASGALRKTQVLTTSGPYAYARHPLYVGSFFLALGYCAMSGRWEAFALGMPLFILLHAAAVKVEDEILLKLYGEEYRAYSRRVPAFIPRPSAAPRERGDFSLEQVLVNREQVNLVCVLVITAVFAVRLATGW